MSSQLTTLELVACSFIVISFCVFIPVCWYGIHQALLYTWCVTMKKRQITTVLSTLFLLQFSMIFGSCCWIAITAFEYTPVAPIVNFIIKLTFPIVIHSALWSFGCRVYSSYYYFIFAKTINLDIKWQSIINNDITTKKKNVHWSVKYRTTLGNDRFIRKIGIIGCLITCAISYLCNFLTNKTVAHMIDAIFLSIIFIFIIICYIKIPTFSDIIFVKSEIKRLFISFCFYYASLMIYCILTWEYDAYDNYNYNYNFENYSSEFESEGGSDGGDGGDGDHANDDDGMPLSMKWFIILSQFFFNIIPSLYMTYVSTFWVITQRAKYYRISRNLSIECQKSYPLPPSSTVYFPNITKTTNINVGVGPGIERSIPSVMIQHAKKFKSTGTDRDSVSNNVRDSLRMVMEQSSLSSTEEDGNRNENGNGNRDKCAIHLADVFLCHEAFDLFIIHLLSEFTIEILVSLMEISQYLEKFKQLVMGQIEIDNNKSSYNYDSNKHDDHDHDVDVDANINVNYNSTGNVDNNSNININGNVYVNMNSNEKTKVIMEAMVNEFNKIKFVRFGDKCNVPQSQSVFKTMKKYEKELNCKDKHKRNITIVKILHAIGFDLYVKYVKIGRCWCVQCISTVRHTKTKQN